MSQSPPPEGPNVLPAGPTARLLAPIEGTDLDPPDRDGALVAQVVDRFDPAACGWRCWERFRDGRGTLAAKGIAYYALFSVLAGLVLAYGLASGVPRYEDLLDDVVDEALPGLIGADGIDPEQLSRLSSTLSIVGGVVLLYTAIGLIRALEDGVRLIYGVQYETRGLAVKVLRHAGYLLLLTPLVALSYVASSLTAGIFAPLLASVGLDGPVSSALLAATGLALALLLNGLVLYVVLSRLGGVRPARWRAPVAALGAVAIEAVKLGSTYLIAATLTNPRYLGLGVPVAVLLLFYVLSVVTLATAALVATLNEDDPIVAARRRQAPRGDGGPSSP